ASVPICLWYFVRWSRNRRNFGRFLIGSAIFATLVAIFYLEEDWRGKRAWDKCKAELEAKGAVLDWDKFIPPPVPDDQNVFKAPNMQEWFVRVPFRTPANELSGLSTNALNTATITNGTVAADYLKWSNQFQPQFEKIREALKCPYARMDGDYSIPYEIPIPNFIQVRVLAQTLAQRAKCHFFLDQPEQALDDLTFLNDSRHLLEAAPTGKPTTLVAAMINVAVTGLYVDTIAKGLQSHAWQEPQLAALQNQLADINLTRLVLQAFQEGPAFTCRDVEIMPVNQLLEYGRTPKWTDKVGAWLWPRGWTYQNMVNIAELELKPLDGFDVSSGTVSPRVFEDANRYVNKFLKHSSPYNVLAAISIPSFNKAWQATAHNQTMVNEAQIACALERYRLANGAYPASLDALAPQFIEKVPHDIIGGKPLIYRRTVDGKFVLYSVGWNETDDGGQDSPANQIGAVDYTKGDWVWKN
ncbi:MAG TPA: hypothetical protein VFY06_16295, partial [Verrucomicrobiae bacterium]|nr:hypothetical protein [Verrucomicrobiae bacterium]